MFDKVRAYTHAGLYIGAGILATAIVIATATFVREKVQGK